MSEVTCIYVLIAGPEIISVHSYWKNFIDKWKLSSYLWCNCWNQGNFSLWIWHPPHRHLRDLCGPVVNDEDFGDYIGPTISCNVLKQPSAVIFHMLLLVNLSRNISWQEYLGFIFIAEFFTEWLMVNAGWFLLLQMKQWQSPFLQNLLALQERGTDGKERCYRSLYRIEHELCNEFSSH